MRLFAVLVTLLGLVVTRAAALENIGSVGPGRGIVLPGTGGDPCPPSTLYLNFDGTAESAYCWQYGGTHPPYFGAFAECYEYSGCVCGIQLLLTGVGSPCGPLTAYVWEDAGGNPGNILSVTSGLDPCPVATWPDISTHDLAITQTEVSGFFWIGYWADWAEGPCGYYVAADLDGFDGCPYTYVPPGYWYHVSYVWGPTQAIGIGAWVKPCGATPARESTWGSIKHLYD